jgi:hypothetical protein
MKGTRSKWSKKTFEITTFFYIFDFMDSTVVKELVGFLSHTRPDVRELALENLSGLTLDSDGREYLKKEDVVRPLCRLIGDSKVHFCYFLKLL